MRPFRIFLKEQLFANIVVSMIRDMSICVRTMIVIEIVEDEEITGMELSKYFKSIIDQDRCAVVICNLEHEIIYMNPAAVMRYAKRGGQALVGQSLLDCHNPQSVEMIEKVVSWFAESTEHNMIYTFRNEKENKDVYMIALRDDNGELTGYYEKHEYRNRETAKLYDFSR